MFILCIWQKPRESSLRRIGSFMIFRVMPPLRKAHFRRFGRAPLHRAPYAMSSRTCSAPDSLARFAAPDDFLHSPKPVPRCIHKILCMQRFLESVSFQNQKTLFSLRDGHPQTVVSFFSICFSPRQIDSCAAPPSITCAIGKPGSALTLPAILSRAIPRRNFTALCGLIALKIRCGR